MTVRQLIAHLSQYDPEVEIVLWSEGDDTVTPFPVPVAVHGGRVNPDGTPDNAVHVPIS